MWSQEEPALFKAKPSYYSKTFFSVVTDALQRSAKIITIFLASKVKVLALCIFAFVLVTTWLFSNVKRIKKRSDVNSVLSQVNFLRRNVFLASLMGLLIYGPLFFANPPMSLLHTVELLRVALLCFFLAPFLTKGSRKLWVILVGVWLFYVIDDVLLETAFGERWGLFIAGLVLGFICIKILFFKGNLFKKIDDSPIIKALVIFVFAQVVLSVVFNLTGRVSLAKIFGVSAVQCLMLGITLKVFCTMILEAIYLQTEAYKESRFSDFINYTQLKHRFLRNLWILACIVWFLGLTRNLTLYDFLIKSFAAFVNQNRSIGSYSFTFGSIAIFFFIIWLSSLISSFISFFFGHEKATSGGKRSSLNSMMLLIRLAIWTVGFLIAVAAAGIPIDKLSIMLGALGVGIGFGLQNIVNNLVSGVILAFERPIQIGDQIEIGNKAGVVKEIGVRSSKIHSAEGSDIIVPNGDLLSQHLINWTMQDRSKRVDFLIYIPYDTDLEFIRTLICERLKLNEKILLNPIPAVQVQDFGEYTVSVKVLFWVIDLSNASTIRTEAMIETKKALTQQGIKLQIRSLN